MRRRSRRIGQVANAFVEPFVFVCRRPVLGIGANFDLFDFLDFCQFPAVSARGFHRNGDAELHSRVSVFPIATAKSV